MLIDQTFLDNLDLKLAEGGQGFHLAPRLTGATNRFQTKSSFSRLRKLLNERLNQDIGWDEVRAEIREIPIAKQQKYSAAVKFIEKSFLEQGSKMFETLRRYGTKLSKSQQRYTIPMVEGDAGHGLCGEMAILWLKEQLSSTASRSDFQRIDRGNVVASDSALRTTSAAMALRVSSADVGYAQMGASFGLRFEASQAKLSFDRIEGYMLRSTHVSALLIGFWEKRHMVALVRENAGTFQLYDANAGSYRIQTNNLNNFLLEYNNVCLRNKWPGYNQLPTVVFSPLFVVSKRP